MDIQTQIANVNNINKLVVTLNDYCEQYEGKGNPVDSLDLTKLSDYSLNIPNDMTGVYSFSDVYLLMRGNDKKGQHFILEAREHFTD